MRGKGPQPLAPPVPYAILPDAIVKDEELLSGLELSEQSEPIESISPFQTTTYSLPHTPDLFNEDRSSRPKLFSHNCSRRSGSSTASHTDKSKSAEMRLQGAMSALKSAEAQIKQKDRQITALEADLAHKSALLTALQGKMAASDTHQRAATLQTTLTVLMRKKEKEQSGKIREFEERFADQQRTIARLKGINKQLLTGMKESQAVSMQSEGPSEYESGKKLKGEITRLERVNAALVQRLEENERETLRKDEKMKEMRSAVEDFQSQAVALMQHNQLLTSHLRRLLSQ